MFSHQGFNRRDRVNNIIIVQEGLLLLSPGDSSEMLLLEHEQLMTLLQLLLGVLPAVTPDHNQWLLYFPLLDNLGYDVVDVLDTNKRRVLFLTTAILALYSS